MDSETIAVDAATEPQTSAREPTVRAPHVRWVRGVAIARVRYGKGRRLDVAIPSAKTKPQAKARGLVLAQLGFKLRKQNVDETTLCELLKRGGAAASEPALRSVVGAVEKIVGGQVQLAGVPTSPTIKLVGERWTSGELARTFPDHVKSKRSVKRDVQRLEKYVYPLIGGVAIDRFELDDAERVMRALPPKLKSGTRKQIGSLLCRIMNLSVFPLRLREHNPIPAGFLPKGSKTRALSYLFPREDAQLLACTKVHVALRMLYGWLQREGMRLSEALAMSPADVDFDNGRVRLDTNKTDDPRSWVLADGSARALRLYIDRFRPHIGPSDPIFVAPDGKPFRPAVLRKLARKFRGHLRAAGITRPELFESSPARMAIRLHDLRGGFVTLSLAAGRTESWVSDRTGHKDWRVMRRYKRQAREFAELAERMDALLPLDAAVPELREPAAADGGLSPSPPTTALAGRAPKPGHKMATAADARPAVSAAISAPSHHKAAARKAPVGVERRSRTSSQNARETARSRGNRERSSAIVEPHGQNLATSASHAGGLDPVEAALADALAKAAAAAEWSVVAQLARELEARRLARVDVVDLDAARQRRQR